MNQPEPPSVPVGMMISEFAHPNIVRIAMRIGYQFGILDREHGAFDLNDVSGLAAASAGQPFGLHVRIASITREQVGPVLDAGVDAIVAPMVTCADDARELVRLAKYPPLGGRGVSLTRAHSGYHVENQTEYLSQANQRVKVYAQIETVGSVESVADIASVRGVDGLIVGPNDLLQSLGTPGDYSNPALSNAMRTVADAAASQGLGSGVISGRADLLAEGVDLGMTYVSMDSDVGNLVRGGRSALQRLTDAVSDPPV